MATTEKVKKLSQLKKPFPCTSFDFFSSQDLQVFMQGKFYISI